MMVLLFKNVRNFVTEEMLMQSLKDMKFNKNEYDKLKRQIEATPNLERLIWIGKAIYLTLINLN